MFGFDKPRLYPTEESANYGWMERYNTPTYEATPVFVGLAGKVYPAYRVEYERKVQGEWGMFPQKITQFIYDLDSLKEVIGKAGEAYLNKFIQTKQDKKAKSIRWCEENCQKFFEADHTKEHGHFFTEHKVAVFVLNINSRRQDHLCLNACLKDVQFFKWVDPVTAFQEISMYISGVLGVGEPNIVEISNEQKARKHGFDKGSFRTHTPGKKAKRRRGLA